MKKSIMVFTALVGMVFSANAFATLGCGVANAKVTGIYENYGHVIVFFNKGTNCPCSFKTRLAYKKKDGAFLTPALIAALKHNMTVSAFTTNYDCPYGNRSAGIIKNFYMR